jgi:amino acid adenylation domain-containing protein
LSEIERLASAVGLSARQREMLAALLAEEGIDLEGEPPIPRLQGREDLPLSFSQQRLWFLQRLEPESPFYNIAAEVRLTGELDVPVLGRALAEVARRHEVLRGAFVEREHGPRVRVAPPRPVGMPVVDLSALPPAEADRLAGDLILAEARRGFDLTAGLLLRVLLLKVGSREHRVVLTIHHVASDGWSIGVLVQEVGTLYAAFRRGGRSPLPELPFQYADFAAWQRGWLQGEVLEKELAHWRAKLEGVAPVLELPLDRPRPEHRSDRGATRTVVLPVELAQSVERLSRGEGVSLFMTLLAAFAALLGRYSGRRDPVIGYPVANRDRSDIERMIGLFLNTLVLRVDLAGDPAFRALLGRVRDEVLEAQSHAQLPFERLVEELRLERSLSHNPLFQVLFVLQNTPASALEIPGLAVESAIVDLEVSLFDLSFRFEKAGDTLLGRLEYSRDLFEATTIERLAGHYTRLLAGAVADPGAPLSELPLLSEADLHQMVREWSDSGRAGAEVCLPQLWEAQAGRTPQAPALTVGEETLSYAELDRRATRLARRLRRMGVGPESRVGILLERSAELVVALLGTLKAGGAYVPLDPALPAERLAWILGDTGVAVLLTEEKPAASLAVPPACRVLNLDVERQSLAAESAAPLAPWAVPDDLAYVIHTSGSTGRPKGVMVTHRALVNFLTSMRERPGLTAADTLLAVTTLSFDIAALEIFLPLVVGARVVLASAGGAVDGTVLASLVARSGATALQATPATWRMLLDNGASALAPLQGMCGGEALAPGRAAELAARTRSFWNLYGPTETTVWSTVQSITPVTGGRTVPIGRPIANTRVLLLDDDGQPVPLGATGHLHIGGLGLARGYLCQPELTAERWVPDPWPVAPGDRLYRTGDLARFLTDGTLEYLGRGDQQVKLRGFRIELGEIEAVIREHPGVSEAAVVFLDGAGDLAEGCLVAYVVGRDAGAPAAAELRAFLRGRLPFYMLPAFFAALPRLPLTPGGKVDRKRLVAQGRPERDTKRGRAPETPAEKLLAPLFAEILKLEAAGVDANFFDLGGHSLLATQLISRLRQKLGVEVPLRVLLAKPVLGDLARFIEPQVAAGTVAPAPLEAPPVSVDDAPPLSFAQQRLWFLDQLAPGSPVYNISVAVELKGRLHVPVLAATIGEVVRRHEALRTTFPTVLGQPVQVIAAHATPGLPVIDLRALPGRERKREVSRLTTFEARRPYDLGRGPLLRTLLLSLGAMQHVAILTVHHIVSDGWSMGVLVREVGTLYAAFLAGVPSPLPELPMQYASFAAWQRQRLSGDFLASELAWWRGQLAGMPPALELPADHPRPAELSGRGEEHAFALKAEALAAITAFSRQHGATLFMTLLTGFLGLLRRYTGEDDLAVGTPIAGRVRVELEPLIGLFVNTLALRVDASGDPEVTVLLDRVRETTLSAYAHQEVPFERLVEELAPERDLSRSPLVQVLFVVQNVPLDPLELPGLTLKGTSVPTGTTKLDLTCTLTEVSGVLEGRLEYSLDLFDRGTIERMAGHLTRLLAAAVTEPRRRISELLLLSDAERQQLLGWNQASPETSRETTLTALWEAQVRRDPEAPAVTFELETLSYGDVNRRANRLGWELRRLGVGPESRVGLLLDRSFEQVVGILGILKAGGAYVPLDPTAPSQRLAYLCADSGIQVLITDGREELPPVATILRLEKIEAELDEDLEEDDRDLPALAGPGNLCYVIYTSGSTGMPKGVLVSHGNVARLLSATERWLGFGPDDVWTLFHSYSFDFSVWEIWGALAYGGRLVIVPYWVSRSPEAFWWLLAEEKVTVLNQTPSAFRQLVQIDGERTPAERRGLVLKWVIFGGEALDLAALAPWYERHAEDAPRLVNMYGITETTVHVSYRPLAAADLAQSHRSPIGAAIPDLGLRVLDEPLGLVPVGVTGEICVGGAGLARGYLGRPELTAERFVPDPFGGEPGARLYRSGDLARYRPDGELEYLGRRDHQVKVRGFRIELGEIEAALLAHSAVRSAVVLPRRDPSGSTSLVAYVEAPRGGASADELRELLRGRLPEYMVPSAFLLLTSLPLTVNGKLDRKALSTLPLERPAAGGGEGEEAPRTPTEEQVAGIFAQVLGLERVGTTVDFFSLGGHSLLATQVVTRVQAAFGVELAVRTVFEAPTVAALAARIDEQLGGPASPGAVELPAVPRAPREGRLELSFAQQRLWFLDRLEPGSPLYNIPAAIRLAGALDRAALAAALTEIVRRHEVLRTTYPEVAGEPEQVVAPPAEVPLPLVDLAGLPAGPRGGEVERLAREAAALPFDLTRGPVLRVSLLALGAAEHVALMVLHHIASDGWSIGVLTGELAALYAAFREGAPSPLPELAIQYADFATWQRRHLSGDLLAGELAWWRGRLAGIPLVLELPADHPRSSIQSLRGAGHGFAIGGEDLAGMYELSRRHGMSLFMTLLAGFAALLQRYTREDDLVVGTPIAGRTRVEVEPLIGLFVNTLVLRVDLSGEPEIEHLLGRVRDTTLAVFAHQELPFERLVEELVPERDLSRPPLVQVGFALQNAPASALELPGLTLSSIDLPTRTAKLELECVMNESGQGLLGHLEYSQDLFEAATIHRLARHFVQLLAGMAAADPRRRLSEFPLLAAAELHQILRERNDTAAAGPGDGPRLHELIAAQAARTPTAVALAHGGETLTYGELAARGGRLARRLRGLGVGPDVVVPVFLERSPDLVVALLAVLQAGGAYLPLEPSHPASRLSLMLDEARPPLLLTREGLLPSLPGGHPPAVCLDAPREEERDTGTSALWPVGADNLAYVLYTSGSTGRPKGVAVTHRGLTNYLLWAAAAYPAGIGRGAPVHSPIGFDLTVTSLFLPLIAGRCAHLLPEEEGIDGLVAALAEGGFGLVKLTPAHLELLSRLLPPERAAECAAAFVVGGEPLSAEQLAFWRAHAPRTRLINEYGPTETVVGCCVHEVREEDPPTGAVPIGRPIANTDLQILDRWLQPVPPGVPGELHIGGAGVARGYLHRPDLTAERFVPDPAARERGARLYRTGDLARALPDGRIEFLGRDDNQVKIRGYRIELGEVEAALARHPSVREAVALARGDGPAGRRLAAYAVLTAPAPTAEELRAFLAERLPAYMVPADVLVLESLPLTANGKVDRRALARMAPAASGAAEGFVAPQGPVEEILAEIWAEVLGGRVERVGAHDDFFALGGHSLLATQVVSRVREAFGVEIPVRALFEAPTVARLAARIGAAARGARTPPVVPVPRVGPLPLSFAQQRLWFLDQLEPGSAVYNIPMAVELTGRLDVAVLAAALAEIVRRHEVLRTSFQEVAGEPMQVIAPAAGPGLPVIDLAALPAGRREREAGRLAAAAARRPFDLGRGPLLRAALLREEDERHVALLTMHHIVGDGWSIGVLVRELGTLYAAFLAGAPSPLPELAVQYADFAVWQRQFLSGGLLESELAWWRGQLAGMPPALELPADHPRPAAQSVRGATLDFGIGPEDLAGLNRLARRHGVTLFMVLLAGFLELLRRYTGEDDLAVGTPVAGRTRVEVEPLIGLFVNTLVLRASLAGGPRVLGLLERVGETTLAAYVHQEVPFERLVEELVPERDLSRPPLVQVLFVVQNAPAAPLELPGLALAASAVPTETAKFDLTCSLMETDGELAGSVEYVRDLFEATTIERLAGHLGRLLAGLAAAEPGTPLPELPLLSAPERHQLLGEWNDTAAAYPRGACLHELVAAQAERTPGAVAASFEGEPLTYRELVGRARQLARHLIALGVEPDGRVGVLLERSLEMIVALLGVLEAGAAYVPLDPALPPERLDLLVESAGLAVVLTGERLAAGWSEIAEHPPTAPAVRMEEDNLAYVIYTSGSTGQPKGVMIPHRGIVNRLVWMQEAYGLRPEDRVLQKTPFGFDVSLWEFFWPLLVGARLVFARPEGHKDPEYLVDLIAREGITTLHFVPSMLEAFLEAPGVESLTSLRRVLVSGEALPPRLVERFFARLGHAELHNLYGPTEASVDVSSWHATLDPLPTPVPIGRPIANHRLHVVDRDLEAQPAGAHGELLLGGLGLARGYLGRPDLTAAAFVPDPFGGKPGGRLYRTGDLVRQLPDGNVQYLGRLDHQVKIRGFRIEPGEIEVALARQPGVREAVVLAREEAGEKRLVAYVVPAGEPAPSPADLQGALRRSLPHYMVPSAFVFLDGLPVTANGKLDRRALSRLAVAAAGPAREFTAPHGPVEEVLAAIWAEVLKLERVGAHDDFFALGGHSLLATQAMSRVREAFRVEMPLRALFEAPTVAALAARVGLAAGPLAPPLVPQPRTGDLPLSFAQQRLWFLDRLAPDNPFYNMFTVVRLSGALDRAALQQAFQEIVRRHEALRTTFRLAGGRPVQVIDPAPSFEAPLVDLTGLPAAGPELARLADEESQRPFDLSRGPLLRASLVRLGAAEHTLLVNVHHIVSDGWSMGILFSELAALYGAFAQGEPSPLPELPIQYADFAVWQRSWLQGERLEAELGYWRRQLAGVSETLQLPYDHPRPALESFRGGAVSFTLPAGLMRGLEALTRRGGATPSITLLAGFNALLSRYSGREDLAVGLAIANRTRREVEGLIGFFVNTLIARTDLSGSPGFAQLLARVRETALEAYAHQELPFERLVEELAPERDLGRNPLTQVMFGYQNFPRREMEIQGMVLSSPEEGMGAARTAKFDLTLFLFEDGDSLLGILEYNRELFEATTLHRLARHLESLLAAAVAAPEEPVALLPFFGEGERHQLAREWNDTDAAYPATASLQELFEEQVRRHPGEPALLFDGGEVSYAELNRRANRLAARLRALSVEPESRVGLCVVRSPELVVGMLGIVKAGAAYVPLDPDYPGERLALMVEDSGVRVLVTQEPALTRLPASLLAMVQAIPPDGDPAEPGENPPVTTSGESLAHVIYTSGSTGRPKGVCIPHRAVARLVLGISYADLGPGQVFSQFAPISFDPSTFEIWGALLNGSRLALAPPYALSLEELGHAIERFGMTAVWLTTVIFHQLVEHRLDLLRKVPQVLAGGDALSPFHVRKLLQELPDTRLVNGYGPTENSCFTTCYTMQGPEPIGSTTPLGYPMANTQVHLLDPQGQPVPIGVAGELCTGGGGLSRGYLGRPDLTAERFVPNPFGGTGREAAGSRLYRTGDLARYFPDGRVEFLGRIDHQVKIRGFRIELGEIEARLGEHPAVLRSVVVAREDVPGDRRLVAYVVQNPAYEGQESGEQTEQVSQWSELFDDLYRQQAAGSDPTFNIVGWNSTYTGLPLPAEEMEEWLADTIERIAALAPRRVLEVGCGTGMILFRVAPGCEQYTATDISGRALEYIDSQLDRVAGLDRSRVQLLQGGVERLAGLPAGSFDTAILNSVAQYFPSADYLAEAVTRLVELVRPGGAVFLGDLRSLPLLEAFHTSLELSQADEEMPLALLRQKVQARRGQESELVIDPAFFAALRERLPGLGRVEIHPKHGRAHNELTGFRYQVVLRVGREAGETAAVSWVDWWETGLTLGSLRRHLEESRPACLSLRNVPNARVAAAAAAVRLLGEGGEGIETAGDLRRRAAEAAAGAIEPQDLWDLSRDLPYEVELGWASPGAGGGFEAVLRRRGGEAPAIAVLLPAAEPVPGVPLGRYTNNPLQGRFARRIAPELRAFLIPRLPEYMVPSAFVLLDALPLSPSGKLDRRRLPAPDAPRSESAFPLVAPRNAVEAKLVESWQELLGVERIGVNDDFFELGGHSLLATQAVSRIREMFGVELPLRVFFETTTAAAVAAKVEDLRVGGGGEEVPPLVPVPRSGRLPLSFAQERLWFLDRLDTRTLAYNESAAFRLEGRLDVAALRWSLDEILRRHESLRTTFPEIEGEAVQAVQPPAPFELTEADLSGVPAAGREEAARELAVGQARRPFDLERGPLERGLLVRLGESEHAVFFFFHHIVFDGWSMGVFVRELSALYGARVAGAPSPLPPLPVQYADFAAWQRRWLRGEALERQLAYWRERLAGIAPLGLATDRPRSILPQAPSGLRLVAVPPALTRRLRDLSRDRGVTLFMTVLAAFQALLHLYTGQDDVAVGSPVANRERGEVEGLIGFFVNMLVLRTDLAGDPSFAELLERVRQVALGAYAHQSLPFDKLIEELRPDRDLRRTPLFQVSFQLLNVPASALELPGLSPQPAGFAARSAKFDLEISLIDGGEGLVGPLDYDADLFDAATMERLLAHLERLLAAAVEDPGRRLSELPLLTPAERHQTTVEWNDRERARGDSPSPCLHHLVALQASRTPEALAVTHGDRGLTFGELGRRVGGLAPRLAALGVGPEVPVALFLNRSVEAVVALTGVLAAGGAYVPLDPSYPAERLAWVLEDSGSPVVVTTSDLAGRLPAGVRKLLVEEVEESAWTFDGGAGPEHPAYVIYTSGSTGRPKGVVVRHGSVMNLAWGLRERVYRGQAGTLRVSLNASLSFDASVQQIVQLAWGHSLHILPQEVRLDPAALVDTVRRQRLDVLDCTPSQLRALLEAGLGEEGAAPSLVLVGGEAVDAELRDAALARTRTHFWNVYGPTECTVDMTTVPFAADGPASCIGVPLPDIRVHVVARAGLAPLGVPGELQVGGACLARGYLGRPDLTAERLVPDPFSGRSGDRLYRTGDLVRWLPDGTLDFLGRIDHQVKVRGFRIELGEVEAALLSLAGVEKAVVIARTDAPGDPRLVAYVTGEATEETLRRQLRERLPDFMIPAAFVRLDEMPLNPSGKVDRRALPKPERGPAPGLVPPRTPVEAALAEIWAEVLGLDRIGAQESFFELGGHSILAILLMARIKTRLGKVLPVAALFSAPTLEALAALVERSGDPARRSPLVAIKPQGERAPFFCVHPVGGNVLCYLELARHLAPEQPVYAFQSPEERSLPATVEEMAARYVRELRRIQPEGPYRLGGWSLGGLIAFEMARQLAGAGQEVDLVALIDTLPPAAEPGPPATDGELVAWFAQDLARLLGHDAAVVPEELLEELPAREKLERVARLAHATGLLPEDFGVAQLEPMLATFAANLQAGRAFVRRPYAGRVALYLSEGTLAEHGPEVLDGWERSALGGVEVSTLPGDHYGLLRGPQVARLAGELTARLAAAAERAVS